MARLENVAVDLIDFEDDRKEGGQGDLTTLAENIKKNGLLSPITLLFDGERYKVIAGRRRFCAVKNILQEETIFATVYLEGEIDEAGASVSENLVRLEMDPVDTGVNLQKMLDAGKSRKEVALSLGIEEKRIAHFVRLARLIPEWRDAFHNKDIDIVMAARLAEFAPDMQKAVFETAVKTGFGFWGIANSISRTFGDDLTKFSCEKCADCSKRTRMNDATLFPDVPTICDICLDHNCYMRSWQKVLDDEWEDFATHIALKYSIDADTLPVLECGSTLPGPKRENEKIYHVGGKDHEVKNLWKDFRFFWYADDGDFDHVDADDVDFDNSEKFNRVIESGENIFAAWVGGSWTLRVVDTSEDEADETHTYEEDAETVFASVPEEQKEKLVQAAKDIPHWNSDNPLKQVERTAGSIFHSKLHEKMKENFAAWKVGVLLVAQRILPTEKLEEMFPGYAQSDDRILFMLENYEKAPSAEDLTEDIILEAARLRGEFPITKDDDDRALYEKVLSLAHVDSTIDSIVQEAAETVAGNVFAELEEEE